MPVKDRLLGSRSVAMSCLSKVSCCGQCQLQCHACQRSVARVKVSCNVMLVKGQLLGSRSVAGVSVSCNVMPVKDQLLGAWSVAMSCLSKISC